MPGSKGSVRASILFSFFIAHVLSQAPTIVSVSQGGFLPLDRNLNIPVQGVILGNTNPATTVLNNALPVAELPPQSARTLYYLWDGTTVDGVTDDTITLDPRQVTPTLTVNFAENIGAAVTLADFEIRLSPPRLEVDPHECEGAPGAPKTQTEINGACRCLPEADEDLIFSDTDTPLLFTSTDSSITIQVPVHTYFAHAPIPGQNPYLRTYRKLCLFRTGGVAQVIDTQIWVAVVHACKDGVTEDTADINDIYTCVDQGESAADAVNLQLSTDGNIDPTDDSLRRSLGAFLNIDGNANFVPVGQADAFIWGESPAMQTARFQRTVCCGSHDPYATPIDPNAAERSALGICIDPAISSCCGYLPYQPAFDRCCSRTDSEITWIDSQCPCSSDRVVDDCNRQGANLLDSALAVGDNRGLLQPVTTNFACCTASKFPRIDIHGNEVVRTGFCFDLTDSSTAACCDDGLLFDPAINQCCPVNGVQTLNLPCPCHVDTDCPENHACCKQIFPPVLPESQGALQCSRFANFPILDVNGGTAPAASQRCVGACFNTGWQICCNGRVCVDHYERCCNNTCCNKFSSSCVFGQRPGSLNSQFNPLYYHFYFEICSEIEAMTGRRAFLVWILPTMLLFATLTSLALIIIVARRATEHIWELTEKSMVFLAAFTVLLSTSYFFSPIFKYGIVIVFLNLFVIVVAVVRTKSMSTLLLIILLLGILYVFDPFNGNIYFSLPGAGSEDFEGGAISTSLLESSQRIWRRWDECVGFYDYFRFDDGVRDYRIENFQVPTFGYCSRTWITVLMIFACLIYITTLLILLLAFFHFAKMHTIKPAEVVALEVVQEPGFYPNQPIAPVFA